MGDELVVSADPVQLTGSDEALGERLARCTEGQCFLDGVRTYLDLACRMDPIYARMQLKLARSAAVDLQVWAGQVARGIDEVLNARSE